MNAPVYLSALRPGWVRGLGRWTVLLLSCSSLLASAQTTNTPARLDYSAFRIIAERNIFNPNRYARSSSAPRRETRRAARVDSCTLVGVMSYEKGPLAFFEGSSSDYRKVLKPQATIAGYKLVEIKPASVLLAGETNTLELRVGMQLRREEEGPWKIAAAPELPPLSPAPSLSYAPRPASAPTVAQSAPPAGVAQDEPQSLPFDPAAETAAGGLSPAQDTATTPAAETTAGGSDDPVLRRLMQRREQEMNR